jgi:hypothetical protein
LAKHLAVLRAVVEKVKSLEPARIVVPGEARERAAALLARYGVGGDAVIVGMAAYIDRRCPAVNVRGLGLTIFRPACYIMMAMGLRSIEKKGGRPGFRQRRASQPP